MPLLLFRVPVRLIPPQRRTLNLPLDLFCRCKPVMNSMLILSCLFSTPSFSESVHLLPVQLVSPSPTSALHLNLHHFLSFLFSSHCWIILISCMFSLMPLSIFILSLRALVHLNDLISATSNFLYCTFFSVHVFAPHSWTGLTTTLRTFSFALVLIYLPSITPKWRSVSLQASVNRYSGTEAFEGLHLRQLVTLNGQVTFLGHIDLQVLRFLSVHPLLSLIIRYVHQISESEEKFCPSGPTQPANS